MDTAAIVAPIQELIPVAPEPEPTPEATPPLIGPKETVTETAESSAVQSEGGTGAEVGQTEEVAQSDVKSNTETDTEDNVIMMRSIPEDQSGEAMEESSAISQSEPSAQTMEGLASEPPASEPLSEPVEDMKRD